MLRVSLLLSAVASVAWGQVSTTSVSLLASGVASSVVGQVSATAAPAFDDLMHARNHAMGGAYHALGFGAESIGGNPATLSLTHRFDMEASGSYDFVNKYGFVTAAMADSATSEVAGGLSYHFVSLQKDGVRRTAHLTTLAMAFAPLSILHLGLAGRHHAIFGENATNSVTLNAGLVLRPFDFLTLSAAGHNLIDNFNPFIQRHFVFAVAGHIGTFTPTAEMVLDFNGPAGARYAFRGGVEWVAANSFPLRLGYEWNGITNTQRIGAGLGINVDGTGIDIAYRYEMRGVGGHLLSLTFKYATTGETAAPGQGP